MESVVQSQWLRLDQGQWLGLDQGKVSRHWILSCHRAVMFTKENNANVQPNAFSKPHLSDLTKIY